MTDEVVRAIEWCYLEVHRSVGYLVMVQKFEFLNFPTVINLNFEPQKCPLEAFVGPMGSRCDCEGCSGCQMVLVRSTLGG